MDMKPTDEHRRHANENSLLIDTQKWVQEKEPIWFEYDKTKYCVDSG